MDVYSSFPELYSDLRLALVQNGEQVDVGEWQSTDISGNPALVTTELENVVFQMPVDEDVHVLRSEICPNLPWADLQFDERVSRIPMNPGESYQQWPWFTGNVEKHLTAGGNRRFTHTYMERFWPKYAANAGSTEYFLEGSDMAAVPHSGRSGIWYSYGDLDDVVAKLLESPRTRQGYFPIWFPEDTGAKQGRVPCTLGYHFLQRGNVLNITYFIRSCDLLRHFRDDVYLACRLLHWVLEELMRKSIEWADVTPGTLTMHVVSLHAFEGDMRKLRREARLEETA